jgi:DNA invertase Pin-like site-specific DNA recombinase
MGQQYTAALYLRLSKDDGNMQESSSIATQKEMLTRYCKENKISIYDLYIDDGYSGTNFQRPNFQRMITDIERGKVNCVITKDLSRLGRNYLETGTYIEIFFPNHGVRYIALNDSVDTLNNSCMDITPFRNLLNDMYAKDISKKIKSAIISRQKQGKFVGMKASYGYIKDPNDHNRLIIDERYAPIVRKIFTLAKEGLGISKIRKIMTDEKILRPAAIAYENGHIMANCKLETEADRYAWSNNSVRDILRNPVYAGHIAGQKRPTISMKNNKRMRYDPERYFVIENMHEPIIAPDEWEVIQRLITSRRKGKAGDSGYNNIFSGLIKCGTCGYALSTAPDNRRKHPEVIDRVTYQCNHYRTYGTSACTKHTVEARDLHNTVLAEIQKHAQTALANDGKMLERIIRKLNLNTKHEADKSKKELGKARARLNEIDRLFTKLYEDRTNEAIAERNYKKLSANYEQEQVELDSRIQTLEQSIDRNKADIVSAEMFVQSIKEYAEITELDAALLNRLIEKITVDEAEIADGERIQRICIFYKFVGVLGK